MSRILSRAPRMLPYAAVAFAAIAWGTWALILRHVEAMAPMGSAFESTIVLAVFSSMFTVLTGKVRPVDVTFAGITVPGRKVAMG